MSDKSNDEIIALLEKERRRLHISRKKFAKLLNMGLSTYSEITNGKAGIVDQVKDKIIRYGINIEQENIKDSIFKSGTDVHVLNKGSEGENNNLLFQSFLMQITDLTSRVGKLEKQLEVFREKEKKH